MIYDGKKPYKGLMHAANIYCNIYIYIYTLIVVEGIMKESDHAIWWSEDGVNILTWAEIKDPLIIISRLQWNLSKKRQNNYIYKYDSKTL